MASVEGLKLRIQTRAGPVGLREKRTGFEEIQVADGKSGQKLKIGKDWLKKIAATAKPEHGVDNNEQLYHIAIKQAMLIGARIVDVDDALEPEVPQEEGGYQHLTSKELEQMEKMAEKRKSLDKFVDSLESLRKGRENVKVAGHKKPLLSVIKKQEDRDRHMLVKYSQRAVCCTRRERCFIIDGGELVIYKSKLPTAKISYPTYPLKDAKVFTEQFVQGQHQEPEFEKGYVNRLKIEYDQRKEAKKGALYLYPKDKTQLKNWKRSFQLARVLVSENDRRSMRTSIGRTANALLIKGWEALFWYQGEMKETRALVQQMSMRLIKVDISRGWTKMKLVYTKDQMAQKRREEQQLWAARFMSEKLARMGTQSAKTPDDVREQVVTKIQERFRTFRDEAIFDRKYPITQNQKSRMRQALQGTKYDIALDVLECEDVLRLSLTDNGVLQLFNNNKEAFLTKVSTYSETNINPSSRLVSVSDNLQALTFASQTDAESFTKAGLSNFVNLDRISQVVLHSAPQLGIESNNDKDNEGVWCTVYGPRVAWGKRIDVVQQQDTKKIDHVPVGVKDGFAVSRALGGDLATKLCYVNFQVAVGAADWNIEEPSNNSARGNKKTPDEEEKVISTSVHVHLLGYRFSSQASPGDSRSFRFANSSISAKVPIADEEAGTVMLDQSPFAVEVVQQLEPVMQRDPDNPVKYSRQILVGSRTLGDIFEVGVGGSTKSSYQGSKTPKITLTAPDSRIDDPAGSKGSMSFTINAGVQGASATDRETRPVSPELVGAGILTCLFSSHRGAWFDNVVGAGRFRLDHVSNFVELNIRELRFPDADQDSTITTYRIRAKLSGITAVTMPMHRSKPGWEKVIGKRFASPSVISFGGVKLSLPLPPGCWGYIPTTQDIDQDSAKQTSGSRPFVEIEVVKAQGTQPTTTKSYEEFVNGAGSEAPVKDEMKYFAAVSFDDLMVDEEREVSVFLGTGPRRPNNLVVIDVYGNTVDKERSGKDAEPTEGCLNLDFALRDRDTVRGVGTRPSDQRTICVGDKAMLLTEEPLAYPQTAQEFRMRFAAGKFDKNQKEWPKDDKGKQRGAQLRDPCLSSEYYESGLADVIPKVPFRPGLIPPYCQDIIPHKFALPYTEAEFRDQLLPGVWPFILDDLETKVAKSQADASIPRKTVVDRLSRHVRRVPVTLLAMYPDGTCDVEVAPNFLESWRRQPLRRFNIPGQVVKDASAAKLAAANSTVATDPDKLPELKRVILKKVPSILLSAMHSTGFHTYDASFKTIDDYAKAPAPITDFNPRGEVESRGDLTRSRSFNQISDVTKSDQLILPAGPLPGDASTATCQFEWALHVRTKSNNDMNRFLAMLRQCVRVDHYNKASRADALSKKQQTADVPAPTGRQTMVGGQLEVVLVEARRLTPVGFSEAVHKMGQHLEEISEKFNHMNRLTRLKGTTSGTMARSTPEGAPINTFVNFRLQVGSQVFAVKGQKVQNSKVISGTTSPCWGAVPELAMQGGWTFRTGQIDPNKLGDAVIHFQVMQESLGRAQEIGCIYLGINSQPVLTNPEKPFRNLWLPLTRSLSDGTLTTCKTGELHVMTRWVTAEQMFGTGGPMPVRSQFLKELWPKVNASRIKEPIYQIEPQYLHYNPNLVRELDTSEAGNQDQTFLDPERPPEHVRRHTEEMYNALRYMKCLEDRQALAWVAFEKRLGDQGHGGVCHYGDLRSTWHGREDHANLSQLNELIEAGIPSFHREQRWLEFTGATYLMYEGQSPTDTDPERLKDIAEKGYQKFFQMGLPQTSDANKQLQEDGFHLVSWESTSPVVPEIFDFHLRRIKKAQSVCTALIAHEQSGICYCESLLVVVFFLLLPQGTVEDSSLSYLAESSAFWLLVTLVSNGAYKDYYGRPRPPPMPEGEEGVRSGQTLCVGSGAMSDVDCLDCCLAYHDYELWVCLQKLGFQLATVFYGAFMRLFATYMPTATVFRFWDILFAFSTDAKAIPSPRAYLIDLAWGIIKSLRDDLIQCESAHEVKTCILGGFGAMYDQSAVVDITLYSHKFLWGGAGFSLGQVQHLCQHRQDLFRRVNESCAGQNELLKIMAHERALGSVPQQKINSQEKGVTTKTLTKDVMGVLKQSLDNLPPPSEETPSYWMMHRPMPLVARCLSESIVDQTKSKVWEMVRGEEVEPIPFAMSPPELTDKTRQKLVYQGFDPHLVNAAQLLEAIRTQVPNWAQFSEPIWRKFNNRIDRHNTRTMEEMEDEEDEKKDWSNLFGLIGGGPAQYIQKQKVEAEKRPQEEKREKISMNEVFISLIICSRGTLGEKANALFNIYSYISPLFNANNPPLHRQPLSRLAKSLTGAHDTGADMGKQMSPPEPEAEKKNALHFEIFSNYPERGTLIGSVFIPTLGQFIGYNPADLDTESQTYNIWGPPPTAVQQFLQENNANNKANNNKRGGSGSILGFGKSNSTASGPSGPQDVAAKDKVCLGDLEMGISWLPSTIQNPEVGQLCVSVKSIRFYRMYITDANRKNPYIYMKTYENGKEKKIKRWDPRGIFSTDQHKSWLTTHGAFGGEMMWAPPLNEGLFGSNNNNNLKDVKRSGENQGWNPQTEEWTWSPVWGKQFSEESLAIDKSFMALSQRRNVMDMLGVRNIVTCILHRSMLQMSNRQAILVADALFNRGGAVPGIIEAVLVRGCDPKPKEASGKMVDRSAPDAQSLKQLKEVWASKNETVHDVTDMIVVEHERQCRITGTLNMFQPKYFLESSGGKKLNLKDMGIKDKIGSFSEKTLWIRYVRGGDGERCTQGAVFSLMGELKADPNPEIFMDLLDSWPQTKITKEEFVSCMLNSPLLGESIRRISATDHVLHAKKSIALDVTIMDAHHAEGDNLFQDAINVQQSILLELWDADIASKDFLGECWLPPLQDLTSQDRDFVLPVKPADFSQDAERGPTKEAPKMASKEVKGADTDPNKKIKGELYVSLAWLYPAYELNEGGVCSAKEPEEDGKAPEEISDRAEIQEKLHTGKLTMKIKKAHNLRRSDALKGRDCDAQITAWIRNDVTGKWDDKPIGRTAIAKNSRNPVWKDEEFKVQIMSGDFAARFEEEDDGLLENIKSAFKSKQAKRHEQEDEEVALLNKFGSTGLKVKFVEKDSGMPGGAATLQNERSNERPSQTGTQRPSQTGSQAANANSSTAIVAAKDEKKTNEESQGTNHKVEIYLNDTIREFKAKVSQACDQEYEYWKKKGVSADDKAHKYQDVKIAYRHLVMVFVPSPKVSQLYAQGLHEGKEYKHAYNVSLNDPSCWQPLDPARTFLQYPQFAFGRKQAQLLRIVEATDSYKLVNLRYKEFDKDHNRKYYEDTNTSKKCYGYAKYYHSGDKGGQRDFEWKPAFISPGETEEEANMKKVETSMLPSKSTSKDKEPKYNVDWVLKPHVMPPAGGLVQDKEDTQGDPISKNDVVFWPRCALMNDNFLRAHREVLSQAKPMRMMGRSDFEIAGLLNKLLDETNEKEKQKDARNTKIPPITVDIIRSYIVFKDAQQASKDAANADKDLNNWEAKGSTRPR